MTEAQERAKLAHLKQSFGGDLDASEHEALTRFLDTEDGREFSDRTAEILGLVRELDVGVTVSPAPDDMGTRFEREVRADAREFRKRFVPFCLAAFALFSLGLLGPVVFEKPGMDAESWLQLVVVLYGSAALFCLGMWLHNRRMLRERDVIAYMAVSERRAPRSLAARLTSWAVVLLSVGYLAEMVWGWPIALSGLAGALALRSWMTRHLRRARLKHDAELWSWWYDDAPVNRPHHA